MMVTGYWWAFIDRELLIINISCLSEQKNTSAARMLWNFPFNLWGFKNQWPTPVEVKHPTCGTIQLGGGEGEKDAAMTSGPQRAGLF